MKIDQLLTPLYGQTYRRLTDLKIFSQNTLADTQLTRSPITCDVTNLHGFFILAR